MLKSIQVLTSIQILTATQFLTAIQVPTAIQVLKSAQFVTSVQLLITAVQLSTPPHLITAATTTAALRVDFLGAMIHSTVHQCTTSMAVEDPTNATPAQSHSRSTSTPS